MFTSTVSSEGVRMAENLNPTQELIEELENPEFKLFYGIEQAKLEFADALREARTNATLTQQQLGNLIHRSQPYIAKLESGDGNPTIGAIGGMLAALDVKIQINTVPITPQIENHVISSISTGQFAAGFLTQTSGMLYLAKVGRNECEGTLCEDPLQKELLPIKNAQLITA
jgi:predicted transcriptional regulator